MVLIMTAKAVFKCHPSSHHFDERHIRLTEAVKIGRSVAKARPTLDNGIFDCKVLSRNHALIWYDDNSMKFFLQDTKSSNGTFVNNNRLSKGSEESPPHEICSGDIIQFGVDVMENSRRGVVTHGCIVAQLSLFHADGTEATRSDSSIPVGTGFGSQSVAGNNNVPSQELYQLSHYLKEALHREQMLEQKLAALQRLVSSTQEATESSWQALIDEDRLLSRLEVVENQLRAYSKANTEESIRKELVALQEDKSNYEKTVKESLKKSLEEKLDACRKLSDTERMLSNSEDECAHVREELTDLKKEQDLLLERYSQLETESQEAMLRMTETDRLHLDEVERLREEQQEVAERLGVLQGVETSLGARAQELQADNDFLKEQLLATKERLEETQEALKQAVGEAQLSISQPSDQPSGEEVDGEGDVTKANDGVLPAVDNDSGTEEKSDDKAKAPTNNVEIPVHPVHHISLLPNGDDRTPTRESGVQVESLWRDATNKERNNGQINETDDGAMDNSVKTLKNTAEETVLREVLRYKFKLEEAEQRLSDSDKSIASLKSEVSQAREDVRCHRDQVAALEERLHAAEENTRVAVERAVAELRERLSSGSLVPGDADNLSNDNDSETSSIQTLVEEPMVMVREDERQHASAPPSLSSSPPSEDTILPSSSPSTSSSPPTSSSSPDRPSGDKKEAGFHNHVHAASMSNSKDLEATMLEIDTLKDEVGTLKQKCSQLARDNETLSKQVQTIQQEAKLATERANSLQSKLQEAELSSKHANAQLPVLQEKLDLERKLSQKQNDDIESLNSKLKEANHAASNKQTELAQCKEREKDVRERLEKELSSTQAESASHRKERERLEDQAKQLQSKIAQLEQRLQRQQEELRAKDEEKKPPAENSDLKAVMSTMEADLQRSYREKERLCDEILRLKSLLKDTIAERDRLKEQANGKQEVAGVLEEKNNLQRQLNKVQVELEQLNSSTPNERPEVDSLKQRLEDVTQELHRAKTNNAMLQIKWVPICVIGIAILAAVFQSILAMRLEV